MELGMHAAVRRVGRRRGRGCLPAEWRCRLHGVGEDGDRTAVGVTAQVRDGPCPRGPEKHRAQRTAPLPQRSPWEGQRPRRPQEYGTQRTVPLPAGVRPPGFFWSPRTATLQGGLRSRMNGHGGPCPARRITKSKTAAAFARLGGTASTPSAGISGTEGCTLAGLAPDQVDPATPADLGRDRVLCISLRRVPRTCSSHEGPTADRTPRGQPKRWAQRTVPLPGWRPAEGILRLWPSCNGWRACDAHAAGTEDRAPPRALPRCTVPWKFDRPRGSGFWRCAGAVEPPGGLQEVAGRTEHW
jgi:hypothetical protein